MPRRRPAFARPGPLAAAREEGGGEGRPAEAAETIFGMTFSGFLILTSNVEYFTPKSLTPEQYVGTMMSECAL